MRMKHQQMILALSLVLLVIGLGMVYSASVRFDDGFEYLKKQSLNAVIALLGFTCVSYIDYRNWDRGARLVFLLAFVFLCTLLWADAVRGSQGWQRFGPFSIQPVEFVRLALLFLLASELSRMGPRITRFKRGLLPLFLAVGVPVLLVVKQNDFGSAMALVLVSGTVLYAAGAKVRHLLLSGSGLALGAVAFATVRPHVLVRVQAWLHPAQYAMDEAYQPLQSVTFMGSGGLFGKGLGEGMARYGYLPDAYTDFIFSVLGEELGFAGCCLVLILFLLLVARAIRISRAQEDPFAQLLALGIGMSIFWYMALNVLVVTRMFPVTGLPLPFISYGGSGLLSHFLALGVLTNIARQTDTLPNTAHRWGHHHRRALEGVL